MNKFFGISLITAAMTISGCGNDKSGQETPKAAKVKPAGPALSTAPIDVVKMAPHGMVADTFDPCVYEPSALSAHFGFPADSRASKRQKDRRCFYRFQRYEKGNAAPFANFHAELSLVFDHGLWKSIGDPAQYNSDIDAVLSYKTGHEELSGLGARTVMGAPSAGVHRQTLVGFPIGGHWSSVLSSAAVTAAPDSPPLSPVYQVDFEKFHALAANLNARLQNPSTVLPE